MGLYYSTYLYVLFLLFVSVVQSVHINCPGDIYPCSCSNDPDFPATETTLACRSIFGVVTNKHVTNLMVKTRDANPPGNPPKPFVVYKFILRNTQVTEVNLGDFRGYTFGEGGFNIWEHQKINLTHSAISQCAFEAWKLSANTANMTDSGLIPLLECVKPASVKLIDFGINDIKGEANFWARLADFTELETLLLHENAIESLSNGPFKTMAKLTTLWLQNNNINQLGIGAFSFNVPWDPVIERNQFIINLDYNDLGEDSINPENGLPLTSRWTSLSLQNNSFTTIPVVFQTFLMAYPLNQLDFNGNPILCDGQLKWLKDAQSQLEYRVKNAFCTNDPTKNIFTSNLVTNSTSLASPLKPNQSAGIVIVISVTSFLFYCTNVFVV